MNREFEKLNVDWDKDLLSAQELAWVLRVSYYTVSRWRSRGLRFPGGTITVREAREWLQANECKHSQSEAIHPD